MLLAERPCVLAAGLLLLGAGCSPTRLQAFVELESPLVEPAAGGTPGLAAPCEPCDDFPSEPILDSENGSNVPLDVVSLFGPSAQGSGPGPCLVEPELGSLFPSNWLRPRFRFLPGPGQTLFEIRLKAARERNDLRVYTSATSWTLPATIWNAMAQNLVDQPVSVSIRGLDPSKSPAEASLATTGEITISAAKANGNIVYWSTVFFSDTQTGQSTLKGFAVGDETVRDVLRPEQTTGQCVACHTATPDGRFIASAVSSTIASGEPAHVELRSSDGAGNLPEFLSSDAELLLAREPQQFPTFSKMHWSPGDRLMLSILNRDLIWTDLEASSQTEGLAWGILARQGDPNSLVTHPAFNAAGTGLAYTSAVTGALTKADGTDVYLLPFNAGRGGAAAALVGASAPDSNEYYPAFSPDDAFVAFNRAPLSQDAPQAALEFSSTTTYNNPWGELFVVSSSGGSPVRLLANDPPACSGKQSPGVTNSWGKWAPEAQVIDGKTYYFLTFSSGRVDPLRPQLYVTPVVTDEAGRLVTYPALYLWNQPPDEGNHTPAWGL